jgi:hypothetical protein
MTKHEALAMVLVVLIALAALQVPVVQPDLNPDAEQSVRDVVIAADRPISLTKFLSGVIRRSRDGKPPLGDHQPERE